MEWDGQLNIDQRLEEVRALLSPEAKQTLAWLSEKEQHQLFESLHQEAEKFRAEKASREEIEQKRLEKFDLLIEKGKKYINGDRWQEWVDYEWKFRCGDKFNLDVIERVVKVMEMLEDWVSPESIKDKLRNEWHSDGYDSIRNTVILFSKHGKEFEKMSKKRSKQANTYPLKYRIQDAIEDLYNKLFV